MTMFGSSASLPVAGSALTCGIGVLAFLLVLYRTLDPPGEAAWIASSGSSSGCLAIGGNQPSAATWACRKREPRSPSRATGCAAESTLMSIGGRLAPAGRPLFSLNAIHTALSTPAGAAL